MATLVTIKNIGNRAEVIDGTPLAIGATLVVDLDDPEVRLELRNDLDYVILPDSAAGTLPSSSGGIVALDSDATFLQIGNGTTGGNVLTDTGLVINFEGDGVHDHLLTVDLDDIILTPQAAAAGTLRIELHEDAVVLGTFQFDYTSVGAQIGIPVDVSVIVPASVGVKAYTAHVQTGAADHILYLSGATSQPRILKLEQIPAIV